MPRAEFHERQYELATNIELIGGRGEFFAPPTPLEKRLGIDAAVTPGDARIWRLLGMTPPSGVRAGPGTFPAWPRHLPPGAEPPFLVSLFIQYKRPDRLTIGSAAEWRHHREPYYRIHLAPHQHRLLLRLEAAVGSAAVVRYAAPEFWRHRDMWVYQGAGQVFERSSLVAPSRIGPGHHAWTWVPGKRGVAHSEPAEAAPETYREVREELLSRAEGRGRTMPREFLSSLAGAVLEAELSTAPRDKWREEVGVAAALAPDDEAIDEFADIALISEAAARVRASWLIVALTGSTDEDQ